MRPLTETKLNEKKNWKWALAAVTTLILSVNKGNAQNNTRQAVAATQLPVSNTNELTGKVAVKKHVTINKDTTQPVLKGNGFDPTADIVTMGLIIPARVNDKKVSWVDTIPLVIQKVFHNEAFKVAPNPVAKGGNLHLIVNLTGSFTVQVFDSNSKLVAVQVVNVAGKGENAYLQMPASLISGTYYIRLINNATGKNYTDKVVME